MKIINIFLLTVMIFLFVSCDEPESSVVIENRLGFDVYCVMSTKYPDTTIDFISESLIKHDKTYEYLVGERKRMGTIALCEKDLWETYVKNDTMILFVFDKNFINQHPWSDVVGRYLIFKKYLITYPVLKDKNCTITLEQ